MAFERLLSGSRPDWIGHCPFDQIQTFTILGLSLKRVINFVGWVPVVLGVPNVLLGNLHSVAVGLLLIAEIAAVALTWEKLSSK